MSDFSSNPLKLAELLVAAFTNDERADLSDDPVTAIATLTGLTVVVRPRSDFVDSSCSIEGLYMEDTQRIEIASAASPRRTKFTALHELGHHLVRRDQVTAKVLADAHKVKAEYSHRVEERIVDAFAAEILVPRVEAEVILNERAPTASDVNLLFELTSGSREACCVRAAQYMRRDGYVLLAEGRTVLFGATSGDAYPIRRGTLQDEDHLLDRAFRNGTARLDQVRMRHGTGLQSPEYGGDAMLANGYTFAVLTSSTELPWGGSRDPGDSNPKGFEFDCPRCGFNEHSWKRCPKCNEPTCPICHWCSCDTRRQVRLAEKRCTACRLRFPASHFAPDSEKCRDCT